MPEDDEALDHKSRKMIYNYISKHPGQSFGAIKRILDFNSSTLRYHLKYLEKTKKINSVKEDGKRYFYVIDDLDSGNSDSGLNKKQKKVLSIIKKNPGISKRDLARKARLDKKSITNDLKKLKKKKMIWKVKSGRDTGYEFITKQNLKDEMLRLLIAKYVGGDIDADTFLEVKEQLEQ